MIIFEKQSPPVYEDRDPIDWSESFPVGIARNLGCPIDEESICDLYRRDDIRIGNRVLNGRAPMSLTDIAPLQRCANLIMVHARTIIAEDYDAEYIPDVCKTSLAMARAILVETMEQNLSPEEIRDRIDTCDDMQMTFNASDQDRGKIYNDIMPQGFRTDPMVVDFTTVHAALARLIGLTKKDLEEAGFYGSMAKGMLSGRSYWGIDSGIEMLVNRTAEMAERMDWIVPERDEEMTEMGVAALMDMEPYETATAWLCFAQIRNEIEEASPWIWVFRRSRVEAAVGIALSQS